MAKKIVDILPPKKGKKITFPSEKEEKEKIIFPELSLKKKSFILIFLFLLFLAFSVSFKFSRAKIKIWPEMETANFRTKAILDKGVQNLDSENKILPGKIFEAERDFIEEFLVTGKIKKYAEGKIRLYNSFTTKEEVWRKGTRFVSADEKLFLSKDRIIVPGAEIKNGKIRPSYVDVEVIASEPGAEYNIGPTKFSIIAFRGTPRYDKYYGESLQPMVGGGEVYQIKKTDLENAEKILSEKVKKEKGDLLKNKIPPEFVFLEEASEIKILEKFPLAKEGQEIEKFRFRIKAKATTLSFKKEDLDNFAFKYILGQLPKEKEIFKDSLKINYSLSDINLELGKAFLSLDFSAETYSKIDTALLKETLAGKSFGEVKTFLEQQPEILRVEAQFFPFWIKKIPSEVARIEIEYPVID